MHARSTRDANRQKGDPARAQPDNQTKCAGGANPLVNVPVSIKDVRRWGGL